MLSPKNFGPLPPRGEFFRAAPCERCVSALIASPGVVASRVVARYLSMQEAEYTQRHEKLQWALSESCQPLSLPALQNKQRVDAAITTRGRKFLSLSLVQSLSTRPKKGKSRSSYFILCHEVYQGGLLGHSSCVDTTRKTDVYMNRRICTLRASAHYDSFVKSTRYYAKRIDSRVRCTLSQQLPRCACLLHLGKPVQTGAN